MGFLTSIGFNLGRSSFDQRLSENFLLTGDPCKPDAIVRWPPMRPPGFLKAATLIQVIRLWVRTTGFSLFFLLPIGF